MASEATIMAVPGNMGLGDRVIEVACIKSKVKSKVNPRSILDHHCVVVLRSISQSHSQTNELDVRYVRVINIHTKGEEVYVCKLSGPHNTRALFSI